MGTSFFQLILLDVSSPAGHPLWRSWDLALDSIMSELSLRMVRPARPAFHGQISTFFFDQLTEFKVNLIQCGSEQPVDSRQLPVLLQVGGVLLILTSGEWSVSYSYFIKLGWEDRAITKQ